MAAIRGAVCCENNETDISNKSVELIKSILTENGLSADDVEAVFFSATSDINACYPAKAVRERLNMPNAAFMCFNEMAVEGALDHCIRACVFTAKLSQSECRHCYLGRAATLRSDLAK